MVYELVATNPPEALRTQGSSNGMLTCVAVATDDANVRVSVVELFSTAAVGLAALRLLVYLGTPRHDTGWSKMIVIVFVLTDTSAIWIGVVGCGRFTDEIERRARGGPPRRPMIPAAGMADSVVKMTR